MILKISEGILAAPTHVRIQESRLGSDKPVVGIKNPCGFFHSWNNEAKSPPESEPANMVSHGIWRDNGDDNSFSPATLRLRISGVRDARSEERRKTLRV